MSDIADELADDLRGWAAGSYGLEACVEVLIRAAGGYWINRGDFLDTALCELPDGRRGLDLDQAAAFARSSHGASGGERRLLDLAISFGSDDHQISLNRTLDGLDAANTTIVLEAVARSLGWHEQPFYHTIVGGTFEAEAPVSEFESRIRSLLDEGNDQ